MKLLISGGTGFFGKALLRHFLGRALESGTPDFTQIVVLSRAPRRFLDRHPEFDGLSWLRFHEGDILSPQTLPYTDRFSHILHAAADSTDAARLTPLERYDQIAAGTRHMLELAATTGASRFLLTSSGGAYGPQPADMVAMPEHLHSMPDPLNPGNVYSLAKRQAEHLCALYAAQYGFEAVVARCFAFVGEDLPLNAHFAIGNFIRDALYGQEIVVGGDGSPVRSYMHQADLAQWLTFLLREGKAGEAYNVGSSEAVTVAELAGLVRELVAPDKPVRIMAKAVADNPGRNRYIPDISKAQALGAPPVRGLRQAIVDTVQSLRQGS
ncbi:NAD(P)-dependent oxidoreductase [Herbaspirillum sp. C7C2]|uniref:NAD-dependent epimerase/dehydratase family protein n=1 Tax=Herbaspirillum sp. C7C2 TaxID=2736666 RepID=UPI001F51B028|nr:NAD(P)-dependent oxidoreductase [Herbaspirillum sp. C7C2]MCI1016468.1 NAD(P)-dependent oxidoreductase [Herbaspirillum sp. C7C2]